MKFLIPSWFLILLISACQGPKKALVQRVELDTLEISARNNPMEIFRESAPRTWNILHTRVALRFDLPGKTAEGKAWIRLHPYAYAVDSLILDMKSMKLTGDVAYTGPGALREQPRLADDQMILRFDRRLLPSDTILLAIKYTAMPYTQEPGGSAAIRDARGLYFINTDQAVPGKPVQIWTQGETEANSHWVPSIDHPNSRSAFRIELTVPDSFTTLSNGALQESRKEGTMRTDIWEIHERIPVYTAMFAIGNFSVVKDSWRGREVSYYVEPEFAPYARQIFRNTTAMMDFYSDITGVVFPWNKYSQVVARDFVSGAMENTTASLFGEFMNQNAREIADDSHENIVAHELFHQWFGDYVTAESWSHITLNESFANYGEYLWWQHKYGRAAADEYHLNDLERYLGSTGQSDPSLVRFHYHAHEDVFDRVSYQKGGRILHYLHQLAGDTAFFKAMNLYLTRHAPGSAEAADWRLAIEQTTGLDWNWFFNQWYYRGGHPVLDIGYNYDDAARQLKVTVVQKNGDSDVLYRLPLKTALIYGDQMEEVDWDIRRRKEIFTYPYKNGIRPAVTPDIRHFLPGEIRERKQPLYWLTQYRVCGDYISRYRAITYASREMDDSSSRVLFRLALRDTMPSIRVYALQSLKNDAKHMSEWSGQVLSMAKLDGSSKVRAAAFDLLGAWKVSRGKDDMIAALTDSSYQVAGAALAALNRLDPVQAYDQAKRIWDSGPRSRLRREIWNIVGRSGTSEDLSMFKKEIPGLGGGEKLQFASSLSALLLRINDESLFEEGVSILAFITINENISPFRKGLGDILLGFCKTYRDTFKKAGKDDPKLRMIRDYAEQMIRAEQDPGLKKQFLKQQQADCLKD